MIDVLIWLEDGVLPFKNFTTEMTTRNANRSNLHLTMLRVQLTDVHTREKTHFQRQQ